MHHCKPLTLPARLLADQYGVCVSVLFLQVTQQLVRSSVEQMMKQRKAADERRAMQAQAVVAHEEKVQGRDGVAGKMGGGSGMLVWDG